MNIVYVAKHESGGNDDEGAIVYALEKLGHRVQRLNESRGHKAYVLKGDFLLMHKWDDPDSLKRITIPKVCWYFDRVETGGAEFVRRDTARCQWFARNISYLDLVFCTDGDWAKGREVLGRGNKFHWLAQGADERYVGRGNPASLPRSELVPFVHGPDILFTGIVKGGGSKRELFVAEIREHYGERFSHVPSGLHGVHLRDLIARTKIVVAPDFPISDRYWSNRVYLMLGFGAFLLHPYCGELSRLHYDGMGPLGQCVYYYDRGDMHAKIRRYLDDESAEDREKTSARGLQHTIGHHLYRHRCEELIRVVKERLKIG